MHWNPSFAVEIEAFLCWRVSHLPTVHNSGNISRLLRQGNSPSEYSYTEPNE